MLSRHSLHLFLTTGNKAVTKPTFKTQFGVQTTSYFNIYFIDTGMNDYLRPSIYSKKYNFTIKATQVIKNVKFIGKIRIKTHQMQNVFNNKIKPLHVLMF
jgi:diaminopimelate decarboxylase